MSPHAMNTFVSDLVLMAQATERLPVVEAELSEARDQLNTMSNTIQRLELKLMDRATQIDDLHKAVREAEVAKDAAETMFLEADERTSRALDFIKATFGNAGSLIQALEPTTKPEPVQVPITEAVTEVTVNPEPVVSVQSDPTSGYISNMDQNQSKPENDILPEPTLGPYHNLRYIDHPAYVPLSDWLAGGGTEEDYYAPRRSASY